jgi:hypothetical protein
LRMKSRLTSTLSSSSQAETFYEGEMTYQRQILPCKAAVGAFNHDNTLLVTPRLCPSPAALPSPPPAPRQTENRNNKFLISSVPKELCFPTLH